MIDLHNLIDYLPYFYKENDTYKDTEGKGLLQRFLDICGNYFNDCPLKDMEDFFDSLNNLESIPEIYLPYYWEFLGSMPFANSPVLDEISATASFGNFDKLEEVLSKSEKVPIGSNPFSTTPLDLRNFFKYTIALYKIRGTKTFFDILFKFYNLEVTINDNMGTPTLQNNALSVNHGTISQEVMPTYDINNLPQDNRFDQQYYYDEMVKCVACLPLTFTVTIPGGVNENNFRSSVTKLIDYFIPFNAIPLIDFIGGSDVVKGISITSDGSVASPGKPVKLNVTISGSCTRYQYCLSFDSTKAPTSGWSNDLNINQSSVIWAHFLRAFTSDNRLQSLTFWVRLSEYPDVINKVTVHQEDITYEFNLTHKITNSKGEVPEKLVLTQDEPELKLEMVLTKYELVNYSGGAPVKRIVNPGYIINEKDGTRYPETDDESSDASLTYTYIINRGGTYKFYASEDPSSAIEFTVEQENLKYGVKIIPTRLYLDKADTSKMYSDMDFNNRVRSIEVIVYNTVDPIGSEKNVEGMLVDYNLPIGGGGVLANALINGLSKLYPDGIPSGEVINLDTLGLPGSLDNAQRASITFRPQVTGQYNSETLWIEAQDTSQLNIQMGIFLNGLVYTSQDQLPNSLLYKGDKVRFALKFSSNPNKYIQIANAVNRFAILVNDIRLALSEQSTNLYVTDYYTLEGDTLAAFQFDPSRFIMLSVSDKPQETIGEPYIVIKDTKGDITLSPTNNSYKYTLPVKDGKCKVKFEGRSYSGVDYDTTELDSIKDNFGNNYDTGETYDLEEGNYVFTIINNGTTYTFNLEVAPFQLVVENISCNPESDMLVNGKASTIVNFYLNDYSNDSGWNTYYLHHTIPSGLASTGKGNRYPNGQQFVATKAGEYYFAVVNDPLETTAKFTIRDKPFDPDEDGVIDVDNEGITDSSITGLPVILGRGVQIVTLKLNIPDDVEWTFAGGEHDIVSE